MPPLETQLAGEIRQRDTRSADLPWHSAAQQARAAYRGNVVLRLACFGHLSIEPSLRRLHSSANTSVWRTGKCSSIANGRVLVEHRCSQSCRRALSDDALALALVTGFWKRASARLAFKRIVLNLRAQDSLEAPQRARRAVRRSFLFSISIDYPWHGTIIR
jgi:hypothetical protein